jgi:SAM-dependent methyltransferase
VGAGARAAVLWYAGGVDDRQREAAQRMRLRIERGEGDAASLRTALAEVAVRDRDAWVDVALGLGPPPDDGPQLPPGGVPYLPCPIDALLRMISLAPVQAADVLVDIGAGVGRAAALVSLLTGAGVIGVEVQPALVTAARALASRLRLARASFIEADAADLPPPAAAGTVFLLYCPFSGQRLSRLLARLASLARSRVIRVACVDLPLPPCDWLVPAAPASGDLAVYRSVASRLGAP